MKKLTCLFSAMLLVSLSCAQNTSPQKPEWKATVKVTGEDGQPIQGANVRIGYYVPPPAGQNIAMDEKTGLTDTNGLFFASEHSTSIDLGFEVSKAGYYQTLKKYELGIASQYDPVKWSPNLTLVLKRIGQPIPMYAKRVEAKIQKENEAVGFDLMVGDWVAPYGSERWTPKLRPVVKLDFSRTAQCEKEQIHETKTQTV